MDNLSAFAKKWSGRVPGLMGCWLGDISDVRVSKRIGEIAVRAGFHPPADLTLPQVSDVVASRVISYGLHQSLAYGHRKYREGEARGLLVALRELGAEAEFWANDRYPEFADEARSGLAHGMSRLTNATFEVGVIAANASTGFIWWRTEED
jgi:hypothetical protein